MSTKKKLKESYDNSQAVMAYYIVTTYRNSGQNAFRNTCENKSNKVDKSIVPLEANHQRQEEEQQRYEHTDARDNVDKVSDLVCYQRFLADFHSGGNASDAAHQRAVSSSNDNSSSHAYLSHHTSLSIKCIQSGCRYFVFSISNTLVTVSIILQHCESKKTRHLTLAHNFTKYWPIFKITSLLE